MCNLTKIIKHQNDQNVQTSKHENANHDHFLPLRNRGSNFGLKTGSRGTPWNSKNAGPGGSDFTKCRFWSFIWHFGHFGVPPLFSLFLSLFHFLNFIILSLFAFSDFVTFSLFLILSILAFLCFDDFWHFFIIFHVGDWFLSLFMSKLSASLMTHFSPSISALPLSPFW